jgi:hypothetical protein
VKILFTITSSLFQWQCHITSVVHAKLTSVKLRRSQQTIRSWKGFWTSVGFQMGGRLRRMLLEMTLGGNRFEQMWQRKTLIDSGIKQTDMHFKMPTSLVPSSKIRRIKKGGCGNKKGKRRMLVHHALQ